MVERARQAMTTAQRAHVAIREHAVRRLQAQHAESSRGKAIDPKNWGAVNLAGNETDVDIQQAMLDEFSERAKQAANEQNESVTSFESDSERESTHWHKRTRTKDFQSKKQLNAAKGRSLSDPPHRRWRT